MVHIKDTRIQTRVAKLIKYESTNTQLELQNQHTKQDCEFCFMHTSWSILQTLHKAGRQKYMNH